MLTASLADYVVPAAPRSAADRTSCISKSSCRPPLGGFRGMGEGGTIGAPAAIANAIADALSPFDIDDQSNCRSRRSDLFRLIEAGERKAQGE